jgi:hypothetical protein
MIVNDPDKGLNEDNIIAHMGDGPCKHLEGNKPGEYSCKVRSEPWYEQTPCFAHTQIESSPDCNCRIGEKILKEEQNVLGNS